MKKYFENNILPMMFRDHIILKEALSEVELPGKLHSGWRCRSIKIFLKTNFIFLFVFFISCKQKSVVSQTALESQTIKKDSVVRITEEEVRNPTIDSVVEPAPVKNEMQSKKTGVEQNVSVEIFSNDTTADAALHGYGYNILMDGKLYVHQPHIPAVAGNEGFASIADAKKVGVLIKYKVAHHIMPPSLTVEELDSLHVVH